MYRGNQWDHVTGRLAVSMLYDGKDTGLLKVTLWIYNVFILDALSSEHVCVHLL